ncbi:MAG: class I SAM-dependent methyltransferase [Myxococcota bacterium]
MTSRLQELRHARRLATTLDGLARVHLLRTGVHMGLFEALREPKSGSELAERLGLAADLVSAWLRAVAAQGLVEREAERYRIGSFVTWLLDAPQASILHALLDQAAHGYGARLDSLPELMKGAERPEFGSPSESVRVAAITRLVEQSALRALSQVPRARSPSRVLDVGCGFGTFLAGLLRRYRDAQGLGIELDAAVAEEARRTLREAEISRRGEIRVGDFMTADLPKGTFDLVLINHGLHYFPAAERAALFRRARSRLSERGVLVIQTATLAQGPVARALGSASWLATADLYLRSHRNLHGLPDPDELRATLSQCGFRETGVVPIAAGGSLVYVYALPD